MATGLNLKDPHGLYQSDYRTTLSAGCLLLSMDSRHRRSGRACELHRATNRLYFWDTQ